MKGSKYYIMAIFGMSFQLAYSQTNRLDSTQAKLVSLDEIVISANKIEETKRTVAQQVLVLSAEDVENSQSQTTADILSNSGNIFVQKSQLGGGSPVIRGFEANRIVLVVDGVRMNNIIYRGGHLQNIVTLDNNILDRVEVLSGPSSTIYGSDALGGVIHLYTKKPLLASLGKKSITKVNAFSRYGSINNEMTGHCDFSLGAEKFGSLSSFTISKFGDLRGGANQNIFYSRSYGERLYHVERIDGKDSLVKNKDRYLQMSSGYSQYDLLQKFLFKKNAHLSHELNIQYSTSTEVPRYDRLTEVVGKGLSYAEWYYGPQIRMLNSYDFNLKNPDLFFQNIHIGANYQKIEESRHTRRFNSFNLSHRKENVNIIGTNIDFLRINKAHVLRFGFDAQLNTLKSTANLENIKTGNRVGLDTRYPDGDNIMMNSALYLSHTWQIGKEVILTNGIRAGYISLRSTFVDTSFYNFPFSKAIQQNPVYSGSIGLINNPSDDWKLSLLVSTGYRAANVDDLSKVFESTPGTVIVPNLALRPEKTVNYEAGVTKVFNMKTVWENTAYYTQFIDAIVADDFQFNGQDSIGYDGIKSRVIANQNKREAFIYGFSSNLKSRCNDNFVISLMLNYTYGRIKTDSSDYPLDHIPPFMMNFKFAYTNKNFNSVFFINYNGWKKINDYYLNGEDNEQYATTEGMPAWLTVNLHFSYKVQKLINLEAGIDNILDTQYRTFSSGINAPGRNVFVAMRFLY